MIYLLLSIFSFNVFSQTYSHDNTFCRLGENSIELEIRSSEQYTHPDESEYGEFLIIKQDQKLQKVVPHKIGRYRLLKGVDANCSKSLSLRLNEEQLAIFLLKNNKPFKDLLVILNYNFKTKEFSTLETQYRVNEARINDGKLIFESASEDCEKRIGQVTIDNQKYNFIEKEFEPWYSFDGNQFKLDESTSYMEFEWRYLYPDTRTFYQHMKRQKKFMIATNFASNRACIALDDSFLCKQVRSMAD